MKLKLNYGNIWHYHNQIQKQIDKDAVCAFFNASKINQFYNDYGLRIGTIQKDLTEMRDRYFQKGEDGKYLTHKVDGKDQWVPKEGLKIEDYSLEKDNLMNREILT